MSLPPVVERELLVAARRRATFQIRFLAAVAAAALGGFWLIGEMLPGGVPRGSGRALFLALTVPAFALALLAGPLQTADCLSRERREGTLGFLFLTDLSGFEVVGGKFAALALVPLHGLLAVFPVAAMSVFLGGVTGEEFARTFLVLTNTLFVSLTTGLWISSLVEDDRQAIGLSLGTLAMLCLGPELAGWIAGSLPSLAPAADLALASPTALLRAAQNGLSSPVPGRFWTALGAQHALGWLFALMAALLVRHAWREQPRGSPSAPSTTGAPHAAPSGPAPGAGPRNSRRARRLFRENPVAWLAWQDSWVRHAIPWVATLGALAAVGLFLHALRGPLRTEAYDRASLALGITFLALKLLLALHAVYLLHGQCRGGMMELLLSTPLSSRTLGDGYLAAMRTMILRPALALALLQSGLSLTYRLVLGGDWPSTGTLLLTALVPPLFGSVVHAFDFVAVAYHASRWALHYDRPAKALLRTALLAILLPLVICGQARILVALLLIGQHRPPFDRFRELAQRWFFPGTAGWVFGAPRPR